MRHILDFSTAGLCGRYAVSRGYLAILGVVAALSGCQTLVPFQTDPGTAGVEIPEGWSTPEHTRPVRSAWLDDLGDPRLRTLLDEAIGKNFDLRAAAARVDAAIAQASVEAAAEQPTMDAAGAGSRGGSATGPGRRVTGSTFSAQLDVAWEVDLWKRLANATKAARLEAQATFEDYAAARLSLTGNTAQAWFDALETELQLELTDETVENFQNNLEIVEEGFRSGLNSALDVRLERANLASARSELEARRIDRDRAVRTLEVLLGRYPLGGISLSGELPGISSEIPAGLPAELLSRRPDIRAAALRLEASGELVNEAQKRWLPSFRLTGAGGLRSGELRNWLDVDAILWSIAAGLTAPIIDAGRIDAQVALAKARSNEALADYAQTLLNAFQEVETALASEAFLARQEHALRLAASESEQAATLALERYRKGLTDIITWLEARRRAFSTKSSLLSVSNQRIQNRITLHLALAGDFWATGETPFVIDGPTGVAATE